MDQKQRQQVGTRIDPDLYREVKALAILQRRTAGEIIDDAILAYLAKERHRFIRMRKPANT
jgi:hypothetical protein